MGCPCEEKKQGDTPRKNVNTWGCGCHAMRGEPQRKGVVKFCDICDPCAPQESNVKLCAFVVPTLEEGRYFRNSFIFVQEDDSTYYISDDRSEIPFGSRPKFINNFDPNNPGVAIRSTTVYDMANQKAYVFDADANYLVIQLGTKEINITGGAGILVTTYGGETFIGIDDEVVATQVELDSVKENVRELEARTESQIEGVLEIAGEKADKATTLAGYGITDAYTKAEVDEKVVGVYHFKGSVPTFADLPTDAEIGDVYNVEADGNNYAWDGEHWDELGSIVDLTDYYNKTEVDDLLANKQDELTAGEGINIENNVISALGTGSGELSSDLTVTNPMGKYNQGDIIPEGTSLEAIFRGILSKTYYPTLTDPSVALSYNANTLMKVGTSIDARSATITLNRGGISPAYGTSGFRSGEATGYTLSTAGADTEFSDTNTTGSFSVPTIKRSTKGNIVLTASASYAAGEQPKDSDGANYSEPLPAGSKSTTKTIEFILPFYYGVSTSGVVDSLTGLSESVTKKGNKTFSFTTSYEHMVVAYDASYGDLTSILDPNGFEAINGWSKSALTVDGQNYNVWVAQLPTTAIAQSFTFKF